MKYFNSWQNNSFFIWTIVSTLEKSIELVKDDLADLHKLLFVTELICGNKPKSNENMSLDFSSENQGDTDLLVGLIKYGTLETLYRSLEVSQSP